MAALNQPNRYFTHTIWVGNGIKPAGYHRRILHDGTIIVFGVYNQTHVHIKREPVFIREHPQCMN
jgi:hypothetical protein